jgi:hypothetical protein
VIRIQLIREQSLLSLGQWVLVIAFAYATSGIALAASATSSGTTSSAYEGPSMIAELVTHNSKRESPKVVNRVAISSLGFRMESDPRDGKTKPNLMIQNFQTRQFWLVDQDRRMFVEIPDDDQGASDTQTANDYETGIMTTRVCGDLPKRALGPSAWRGNKVTVWLCERGPIDGIKQFYSPYWRLVVREEHADGRVSELKNIKRMTVKAEAFRPPTGFRSTDINEFMGVIKPLETYQATSVDAKPEDGGQRK